MASRRDELNAYTFAKRRLLAAFVQPSATGSEESAPRPLRALVPGVVIAVVIMAAFGAWGMLKPTAPQGWNTPGEKVIIASKSTTRYVVLKTKNKPQLHPVLNMASAKLLLDPDKGQVINVDESVLDSGKVPHGVTIGIPYAPDRLPDPADAGAAKRWAVCQRPGDGGAIQKAAFVFDKRERGRMDGAGRLRGGDLLYVQGPAPDNTRYVVDASGTAYPLDNDPHLIGAVVTSGRHPQRVSEEWLNTLHKGDTIAFPGINGTVGSPAGVEGTLNDDANRVGMILRAHDGSEERDYLVLPGRVEPISTFMSNLLLQDPDLSQVMTTGQALQVNRGSFPPSDKAFGDDRTWPQDTPRVVNTPSTQTGARNTVCNVLRSVASGDGATALSAWAGTAFPATLATGSSSAYVTPGSGQLYRQFQGTDTKAGPVFLVTDTGLRYTLQQNGDSATGNCGIGDASKKNQQPPEKDSQTRLGYGDVTPAAVPAAWSEFLPTGPRLSKAAACQPQGS